MATRKKETDKKAVEEKKEVAAKEDPVEEITVEASAETFEEEVVEKTLTITDSDDLVSNDIEVTGDPNSWKLICKVANTKEKWMKSTKALVVGSNVILQVSTQQINPDGSNSLAEALVFVPNSSICEDADGNRSLIGP